MRYTPFGCQKKSGFIRGKIPCYTDTMLSMDFVYFIS